MCLRIKIRYAIHAHCTAMTDIDRLYRYKSLLASRHAVSSDELMAVLGISIATLKRDMANLRESI